MAQAEVEVASLKRVLISNRGEVAIRIAKAASALGMESVGVYAPVDSLALHTRFTNQTLEIGGTGSSKGGPVNAYLDAGALIGAAKVSGCDCVHPGYGFLSESAAFAALCASEGLVFVGPPPSALSLFGDKVRARSFAEFVGIPVVPGSTEAIASPEDALAMARDLGYPVMLKAAAGGGGRGMRLVQGAEAMAESFERCRCEAQAAFGDGTLSLE